jgi:hypothetical protein
VNTAIPPVREKIIAHESLDDQRVQDLARRVSRLEALADAHKDRP